VSEGALQDSEGQGRCGEDTAHVWEGTYCCSCHEDVGEIAGEATLLI
jgi:hypothetical protein